MFRDYSLISFFLAAFLCAPAGQADTALIAVASNFAHPARELAADFEAASGHRIELAFGSSGKLATQIVNGAPFDAFLSADQSKIDALVERGLGEADSQATYALGQMVLWSATDGLALGVEWLQAGEQQRLAYANPRVAPYGVAAQQVLDELGVSRKFEGKIVLGENIAQTYQFVATGAATAGFVALSQMAGPNAARGSQWRVPTRYHDPIRQDLVVLTRGRDNQAAVAFVAYLQTQATRDRLIAFGYEFP
jgi:molybdenum ABC transporter molybdate-binding protein